VLLQVAVYVGMPAGLEGTRAAEGVLGEGRQEREGRPKIKVEVEEGGRDGE
jgi:hypothetical protein